MNFSILIYHQCAEALAAGELQNASLFFSYSFCPVGLKFERFSWPFRKCGKKGVNSGLQSCRADTKT